jgi:hypothetical protein
LNYFFPGTKAFFDGKNELGSLTWTTVASLWTMRAQVKGYTMVARETTGRDPTAAEIKGRFLSGIEYMPKREIFGVDLPEFFLHRSWPDDLQVLARFTLTNVIALYEGWLDQVVRGSLGATSEQLKQLQAPTSRRKGKLVGCGPALAQLGSNQSKLLVELFAARMPTRRDNHSRELDAMMVSYRAFKSIRNCFVHRGGLADALCVAEVKRARSLTQRDLAMEVPVLETINKEDESVSVSLYGVVGFMKLLQRIVITQESVLALSKPAERILLERWKARHPKRIAVPARAARRAIWYRNELSTFGFPSADDTTELHRVLEQQGLVVAA